MSEAVREAKQKGRPEFRNIGIGDITGKYRMPPSAIVSILHRISGAGLFLMLPFLLYLFQQSLLIEMVLAQHFSPCPFIKSDIAGMVNHTTGVGIFVIDTHRPSKQRCTHSTSR